MRYSYGYPAIARRFPELGVLQRLPAKEANELRTEAYRSLYEKLPIEEKQSADMEKETLRAIVPNQPLGEQGAWELLVALAQVMEWQGWPER